MRFVIITLPPPDISQAIERLRRPLAEQVGSREALRYPPHITLRTGLVCPDDQTDTAARAFLNHAQQQHSVAVQTSGMAWITYGVPPRCLAAWSVEPSGDLMELHRQLLADQRWAKGPQGEYHPHLTLAFHDLTPERLAALRKEVERQPDWPSFHWTIDHVALYFETPSGWVEWDRVSLKPVSR